MDKKLWYKMDLDPTGALRDDLDMSFVDGVDPDREWLWGTGGEDLKNIFNESWLDYLESKKCRPQNVLIFYKPKNYRDNIHIDQMPSDVDPSWFLHYGLNLVGNPGYMSGHGADEQYKDWKDTATMRWYSTEPEDHIRMHGEDAGFEFDYVRIPEDSSTVIEMDRANFADGIYLANAWVPHQIVTTNQPRLCFSMRWCTGKGPKDSWESTVEYFNNHNLLIT